MTYVDQCDTIRTLTEEELTVVSGGGASAPTNPWNPDAFLRKVTGEATNIGSLGLNHGAGGG
jgi:hypothetical protein